MERHSPKQETKPMKTILQAALISGVMSVAAFAVAAPAFAQIDISIGYRDGYWDTHHQWHAWSHPDDYKQFSRAHPEHYRDINHSDDHGH
jgi:hypothetical protein